MRIRKTFSTSIDETVQKEFKRSCLLSEPELPMNVVLEILMDGYNKGTLLLLQKGEWLNESSIWLL